jgi:hypothetical protein
MMWTTPAWGRNPSHRIPSRSPRLQLSPAKSESDTAAGSMSVASATVVSWLEKPVINPPVRLTSG